MLHDSGSRKVLQAQMPQTLRRVFPGQPAHVIVLQAPPDPSAGPGNWGPRTGRSRSLERACASHIYPKPNQAVSERIRQ